jgi:hypothetical protein
MGDGGWRMEEWWDGVGRECVVLSIPVGFRLDRNADGILEDRGGWKMRGRRGYVRLCRLGWGWGCDRDRWLGYRIGGFMASGFRVFRFRYPIHPPSSSTPFPLHFQSTPFHPCTSPHLPHSPLQQPFPLKTHTLMLYRHSYTISLATWYMSIAKSGPRSPSSSFSSSSSPPLKPSRPFRPIHEAHPSHRKIHVRAPTPPNASTFYVPWRESGPPLILTAPEANFTQAGSRREKKLNLHG